MRLFGRALVGAMAVAMVSAGAAQATTGSAPVTADDAVTMTAYDTAEPDVLANDSDPDGDKLAVCRVHGVPAGIRAAVSQGKLEILATEPGTYSFTYYACDYSYLTPATVTVTVEAPPQIHIRVSKSDRHPGRLRVVNKGDFGFSFQWGSYKRSKADGHVGVAPHSHVWVKVRRVSLIWVASNLHKGAFKAGIVRHIRLPKGTHALPPGAPSGGTAEPIPSSSTPPRWIISSR